MINQAFIREVGLFRYATRYGLLQFRKRVLKQDSKLRLPAGNRIILPRQSRTSTEIFVTNANLDWGSEAVFARYANPRRDFLDIGAHIGYYAAYLSPLVRRAYAFEPDARNFPGLRRNADLARNIEVVEMAVSSKDGVADFFPGNVSSTGSLNRPDGNCGSESVRVRVTTVDTFVAEHPGIDVELIKTDIEGHDLEALHGMERTVTTFQPLILTECELCPELQDICKRWNYGLYGFTRERKTRRPHFREFRADAGDGDPAKMLFLVPEALRPDFDALVQGSPAVAA